MVQISTVSTIDVTEIFERLPCITCKKTCKYQKTCEKYQKFLIELENVKPPIEEIEPIIEETEEIEPMTEKEFCTAISAIEEVALSLADGDYDRQLYLLKAAYEITLELMEEAPMEN